MKNAALKICGAIYVFLGVIFIFNSMKLITGFAISGELSISESVSIGLFFLICGILVLFVAGRERKREFVRYAGRNEEDAEREYQRSQLEHAEKVVEDEEDFFAEHRGDEIVLGPRGEKLFLPYVEPSKYEVKRKKQR